MSPDFGDGTRVVHAVSGEPGDPFGAQPVFASAYHLGGEDYYGRAGNPTWRALESALGTLDGGECVVFPSGMAAISTLLRTVLSHGGHSGRPVRRLLPDPEVRRPKWT